MSPFCMYTGKKSWTPLVDRVVDDALLQTVPHVNQTLLQIANISHLRPINTVLHHIPHLVGNRGCWEVADWQQWKTEPIAAVCDRLTSRIGRWVHCPAEKWRNRQKLHDIGQLLLFQQHVPDILTIYFDARIHKYEVGKNSLVFVSKNYSICIYCACKITKLAILISQGSAATQLRCGEQCNENFVVNTLTNSTVKKFWKSVNICQSYRQKYRGPFFWDTV